MVLELPITPCNLKYSSVCLPAQLCCESESRTTSLPISYLRMLDVTSCLWVCVCVLLCCTILVGGNLWCYWGCYTGARIPSLLLWLSDTNPLSFSCTLLPLFLSGASLQNNQTHGTLTATIPPLCLKQPRLYSVISLPLIIFCKIKVFSILLLPRSFLLRCWNDWKNKSCVSFLLHIY